MKRIQKLTLSILLAGVPGFISGCTIFTSSSEHAVFAGNSEDMCTTNTLIHLYNFHNFSCCREIDLNREFLPGSTSELMFRMMNDCIDDGRFEKAISFRQGKLFDFSIVPEHDGYLFFDSEMEPIGETVVEVKPDSIITININDWKTD